MGKHRTKIFAALVIILLLTAAVMALMTGRDIAKMADSAAASPKPAQHTAVSDEPENTPVPEKTPEPTPVPEAKTVDESGSIWSPDNEKIGIRADWHLTDSPDGLSLDISVYLVCYSIDIPGRSGVIRVCGEEYEFMSDEVSFFDDDYKHDTLLYSTVISIPAEPGETLAVPISVSWDYNAGYGSKQYGTLTADTTLTVEV